MTVSVQTHLHDGNLTYEYLLQTAVKNKPLVNKQFDFSVNKIYSSPDPQTHTSER
jgi:hypothetical protein